MEDHDFLFKLLIIGEAATGKSCLLHRFLHNEFHEPSTHTVGVAFASKYVHTGRHKVKLQIWDTAGQERFRSVTNSYFRGAAGAMVVYDVTSPSSFQSLEPWVLDARRLGSDKMILVLVGNKTDLPIDPQQPRVPSQQAQEFAKRHGMVYCTETSARTGEQVEEAFLQCARAILTRIETGALDPESVGGGIQYGNTRVSLSPQYGTSSTGASSRRCC